MSLIRVWNTARDSLVFISGSLATAVGDQTLWRSTAVANAAQRGGGEGGGLEWVRNRERPGTREGEGEGEGAL